MATIVQQTNGEKTIYTADEYTIVQTKLNDIYNTQLPSKATQTDMTSVMSQLADIETIGVITKSYPRLTGETDDSPRLQRAINDAINKGLGKVFITENNLTLKTCINFTNLSNGLVVEGLGMGAGGTTLIGSTSGLMIDLTGSQYVTLRNLFLKADGSTTSSTIGILKARSTTNSYSEFNNLENVKIDMGSNSAANSNQGTIGLYNYGAELSRYRNVHIIADNPVCFDGNNSFSLTSPFTTLVTGTQSMSECVIDGSSTLTGYANYAGVFINTTNIKLDNIYALLGQAVGSNNKFAFKLGGTNTSLNITGHVESYPKLMYVVGTENDLNIKVSKQIMASTDNDQIVLDGSAYASEILGGEVSVYPMLNAYAHNVIKQTGTSHNGVINCDITLFPNQGISIPYGYATGTRIRSSDSNPSLSLPTNAYMNGLMVITKDKTKLYGNLEMLGGMQYQYGGGPPTSGTWSVGDRVKNNFPSAGGYEGWICITAGTPGTWKGYGVIQA